ncbi:hypothetical protein BJV78DRAFT_1153226 [Lactifluus subvellereus]|nr:hypothetical protein BJV78DRAFT_1153226 [Lactifluus subvellereus]
MNSLQDDPEDNVTLSALQSIANDGTPDGRCQGVEAKLDHGRLREALLLNRAVCNLELRYLENYDSVLRDCATVIAANTRAPSKPYYHMGLALLALEQPGKALDARTCLGGSGGRCGVQDTARTAEEERAEMARKAEEGRERARRTAEGEVDRRGLCILASCFLAPACPVTPRDNLTVSDLSTLPRVPELERIPEEKTAEWAAFARYSAGQHYVQICGT